MSGPSGVELAQRPDAGVACDVCSHPIEKHDPIALRYCAATQQNALSRACICPGGD
jgi:hypothetical protein